jgi:hypothetical protein
MKKLIILLGLLSFQAQASFIFHYGLNYDSQKDSSSDGDFSQSRTFNKIFLGASVNGERTLFFGWNINSWGSTLEQGSANEDTYDILEMGPRLQWFLNDNYNWYVSAEWNPYAKGTREKAGTERDITGSGLGFGFGYRFRISRLIGFGASLQYHSLSMSKETQSSTESSVSDSVTNFMPMLEFSLLTR